VRSRGGCIECYKTIIRTGSVMVLKIMAEHENVEVGKKGKGKGR